MAKKVRTPEEVQARLEKKAAKRKLFFGTFTKALAFFLAIAMVYSLAIIAFTPATVAPSGGTVQSGNTSNGFDDYDDGSSNAGTGDAGNSGNAGNAGDAGNAGNAGASDEKAKAVAALNNATAAAAKKSYTWERKCYFTQPLDVGSATDTLNGIIQRVDSNANIDSVVGGFIGRTGEKNDPAWTAEVVNGQRPAEGTKMTEDKYLMIATKLTASDVASVKVDGDKYTFNLVTCKNPQKDGKNALNHVTNDFITLAEVQKGVKDGLGSLSMLLSVKSLDADYESIVVTAEIKDGNLVNFGFTYHMNVKKLELSVATGNGAGDVICTYKNFK